MNAADAFAGILGLIVAVLAIVIAVIWIVFPWVVDNRLTQIVLQLRSLRGDVERMNGAPKELPPVPDKQEFHVYHAGKVIGPYPRPQLEELLRKGTLTPQHWVIETGGRKWQRAAKALAD